MAIRVELVTGDQSCRNTPAAAVLIHRRQISDLSHHPRRKRMNARKLTSLAGGALLFAAAIAQAQVPQYGQNINMEQARKVAAAAEARARKSGRAIARPLTRTPRNPGYLRG